MSATKQDTPLVVTTSSNTKKNKFHIAITVIAFAKGAMKVSEDKKQSTARHSLLILAKCNNEGAGMPVLNLT